MAFVATAVVVEVLDEGQPARDGAPGHRGDVICWSGSFAFAWHFVVLSSAALFEWHGLVLESIPGQKCSGGSGAVWATWPLLFCCFGC